jgi:hypothetical protein
MKATKSATRALMYTAALTFAGVVNASDHYACNAQGYDDGVTLDAGLVCPFPLTMCIKGRYGWVLDSLTIGKGSDVLFVNESTQTVRTTRADLATQLHTTMNADQSMIVSVKGYSVSFPAAGDDQTSPSTILRVGNVIYTVHPEGNYETEQANGNATDVCAALSQ